ncbi:MAG TPA: hypothetical protein VG407_15695 [Caulobacteraceae bacterium]|nr:hypothetical protein [Caulobacteraceae bacterium]
MPVKAFALIAVAAILLAGCEKPAPSNPAAAAKAPEVLSASDQASIAVKKRFGDKFISHEVIEEKTPEGIAACGYYSSLDKPREGYEFIFVDGRLIGEKDQNSADFRALVEKRCPDFVLRPNMSSATPSGATA